jgi:hypothetical protein
MIIYVVLSNCIVDSQPSQEEDTARSGEDEDVQRSKRGKSQAVQQRNNLPLYLVSLALLLLTPTTDQAGDAKFFYKSAREVPLDLQLVARRLGVRKTGMGDLVKCIFGTKLERKFWQQVDWHGRP